MNKLVLPLAFLIVVFAGLFLFFSLDDSKMIDLDDSLLKNIYKDSSGKVVKFVYATSDELGLDDYRTHCASLNGLFEECGNICEPGATACVEVCAVTCTLN